MHTFKCTDIQLNSSPLRILIVVNVFRPDLGGGVLFADLCDGLHERGLNIHVKCAYPYYPEWSDKSGKNGLKISHETDLGYVVERHGLFIPRNPNSLIQRLIYEGSFFLSLLRKIPRKNTYDAILVFNPLIGAAAYAGVASFLSKTPVWLNVQDLSAQAAAAGGIAGRSKGTSVLERIQNAVFRRSSFWSSISTPMVDTLKLIPGAPSDVHLIPNWLHSSLAKHILEASSRKRNTLHSPVKLLYSGNVGGKQNLLAFCEMLKETDASFSFRIQGAGSRFDEVTSWMKHHQDPRFEVHGLSDEKNLAIALAEADFFVITEKPGAGNSFVPSKLIPSLASRTPVLALCDPKGPLGQEMEEFGLGCRLDWNAEGAISAFFSNLNSTQLASWQSNCASRSSFYTREQGIDRCEQALTTLSTKSTS